MRKLCVHGRYLYYKDGEPFFYLGDTAWEIYHRLNREEAAYYLKERARQGFTAYHGVALAELEGLTVPNAYGRLPLCFTGGQPDPEKPEEKHRKIIDRNFCHSSRGRENPAGPAISGKRK